MTLESNPDKAREGALLMLLDDPAESVQVALEAEFERLGDPGKRLLRRVLRDGECEQAEAARRLLEKIHGPEPEVEFVRFIRSLRYELESGCLLIQRTVEPHYRPELMSGTLSSLARRVRDLTAGPAAPIAICRTISRVLFHESGFRGLPELSQDPAGQLLGNVLRTHRGGPAGMALLYTLVARRVGLDLEVIEVPGRFIVGCFDVGSPLYIDPFERGTFRQKDELLAIFRSHEVSPQASTLAPLPVGALLNLLCRMLAGQYGRQHPARARLFQGFVKEFEAAYRRETEA